MQKDKSADLKRFPTGKGKRPISLNKKNGKIEGGDIGRVTCRRETTSKKWKKGGKRGFVWPRVRRGSKGGVGVGGLVRTEGGKRLRFSAESIGSCEAEVEGV